MPPLPETIILVLAPFAPLFTQRVWLHVPALVTTSWVFVTVGEK